MTHSLAACARRSMMVFAVVAAACAPSAGTPKAGTPLASSIMDPYLKIQDALANDSTDGIRAAAGDMATAATALGAPAMKVYTAALSVSAAAQAPEPDIKNIRDRFGALSEALDTYVTGEHLTAPDGVRVAVCPMVHKPWFQQGDTIANPYYGKEMPSCGNFR